MIDDVALAIAKAQNADYWVDEIADWEGSEEWEREAHPESHPWAAYEDREWYRKSARAALDSVRITIAHEGGNTVTGTPDEVLNRGHLMPGWTYVPVHTDGSVAGG